MKIMEYELQFLHPPNTAGVSYNAPERVSHMLKLSEI